MQVIGETNPDDDCIILQLKAICSENDSASIIDLNASALAFDEELGYLIISCNESVYVYTVNATFVLEHKLDCRVCSVSAFGNGFSQKKRFVACGLEDGRIVILGYNDDCISMRQVVSSKVSLDPIVSIFDDDLVVYQRTSKNFV